MSEIVEVTNMKKSGVSRVRNKMVLVLVIALKPSDIAEYLNFSSQSYFIACFKEATAQTPRKFRQSHYQTTDSGTSRLK